MNHISLDQNDIHMLKELLRSIYRKIKNRHSRIQGFQIRYKRELGEDEDNFSIEACSKRPMAVYYNTNPVIQNDNDFIS